MENRRIETQRLMLRPITQEDAPAVFAWASDPEVNRYMPYPLHKSIEETRAWIASLTPEMLEFGFYRKENGQLIGTGGVGKNEEGVHTLGYNLRHDAWGYGYATEAAQAILAWAYHSLGVRDFVLGHAVLNTASGNVARKCGFQLTHYGQYSRFDGSETFDAAFYELHLKGDEAYVY